MRSRHGAICQNSCRWESLYAYSHTNTHFYVCIKVNDGDPVTVKVLNQGEEKGVCVCERGDTFGGAMQLLKRDHHLFLHESTPLRRLSALRGYALVSTLASWTVFAILFDTTIGNEKTKMKKSKQRWTQMQRCDRNVEWEISDFIIVLSCLYIRTYGVVYKIMYWVTGLLNW